MHLSLLLLVIIRDRHRRSDKHRVLDERIYALDLGAQRGSIEEFDQALRELRPHAGRRVPHRRRDGVADERNDVCDSNKITRCQEY